MKFWTVAKLRDAALTLFFMIEKDFFAFIVTKCRVELLNFPAHSTPEKTNDFLNELYKRFKNAKK